MPAGSLVKVYSGRRQTRPRPIPYRSRTKKAYRNSRYATRGQVKRMINTNIETKWYQFQQSTITVDNNAQLFQLNSLVGQGSDAGQRIGYQIRHKKLDFMYRFYAGTSNLTMARIILFWYRNTALATPVASDILVATDLGTSQSSMARYSFQNGGAYQIIYDKVHLLSGQQGSAGVPLYSTIYTNTPTPGGGVALSYRRVRKYLKDKLGEYEATTGGTMTKGALYCMVLSDVSSVGGTNRPSFYASWTLTYQDG